MPQSGSRKVANLVPSQPNLRIRQTTGKVTPAALQALEHLIVVMPTKAPASVWKSLPNGADLKTLSQKRKLSGAIVSSRLSNSAHTGVSLQCLPADTDSTFAQLSFAGGLAAQALKDNPASVGLLITGFSATESEQITQALILALIAHNFALPTFKSSAATHSRLRTIQILGNAKAIATERLLIEGNNINLARWLTSLPPNKLDATTYRLVISSLAKEHGLQMQVLDEKALRKAGAGAFLAVAQGNASKDASIIQLRYRPKGTKPTSKPHIALVGKGIIFDTGGTNLKPFQGMLDMHCDMAGSAVALATLLALSQLDYDKPVDCWLAITENRLSNEAYKSRDIVTAANGTTIEVIHTDAEGRMALADTLALAGQKKPATIIDFATLTGTCVSALTDRYSGAFTNRAALHASIIEAGSASGERVWPFPMDADFDEEIKSKVADVLQCAAAGGGDHIQAARFLQRFVPAKSDWIHLDLSAATRTGGLAQVPTKITGFGVRYTLNLILDQLTGKD